MDPPCLESGKGGKRGKLAGGGREARAPRAVRSSRPGPGRVTRVCIRGAGRGCRALRVVVGQGVQRTCSGPDVFTE